ncbi:MAG: hypothetical protein EYC62_05290 [Alphaproteobacteria bacterium]|nr:MAG: hypothetical protein EYC62_05290 [Alphaproteobacteria bacterium]
MSFTRSFLDAKGMVARIGSGQQKFGAQFLGVLPEEHMCLLDPKDGNVNNVNPNGITLPVAQQALSRSWAQCPKIIAAMYKFFGKEHKITKPLYHLAAQFSFAAPGHNTATHDVFMWRRHPNPVANQSITVIMDMTAGKASIISGSEAQFCMLERFPDREDNVGVLSRFLENGAPKIGCNFAATIPAGTRYTEAVHNEYYPGTLSPFRVQTNDKAQELVAMMQTQISEGKFLLGKQIDNLLRAAAGLPMGISLTVLGQSSGGCGGCGRNFQDITAVQSACVGCKTTPMSAGTPKGDRIQDTGIVTTAPATRRAFVFNPFGSTGRDRNQGASR